MNPDRATSRRRPPETPNGRARGFTLLELLTVVVIVAVFAALAIPTAATRIREGRSAGAANQITTIYRVARMRALGRGAAVLVRYDKPTGFITVREAVAGAAGLNACALSTLTSCINPPGRWDTPNLFAQIDQFAPFNRADNVAYEYTRIEFRNESLAVKDTVDVCFTPSGNAFYREAFGVTVFQVLDFIPSLRVWTEKGTTQIGPQRLVYVLPNGVARVQGI